MDITIAYAQAVLKEQNKELRKINNKRFVADGYEYKIEFCGGIVPIVIIEGRQVGKRKFRYVCSIPVDKCRDVNDIEKLIEEKLKFTINK